MSLIKFLGLTAFLLGTGIIIIWASHGTNADFRELFSISGLSQINRLISEMFPPNLTPSFILSTIKPLIETIQISIMGIFLGIAGAVPLSLLAVRRNILWESSLLEEKKIRQLFDLPYYITVLVLNFLRSIPELVWALIFIAAVGLGPFAGVLALAIHEVGTLGKLYSELFESVDLDMLEVLQAGGAGKIQIFFYGILPQAFPQFVSITLYRWECITRTATILGFVGAGGIGQQIDLAMRLFQYDKLLTLIVLSLFLVTIVNGMSAVIRKRLI